MCSLTGNARPVATMSAAPSSSRLRRSWRGAKKPTASVSTDEPASAAVATSPDLQRRVADRRQIGGQQDDGEAVAETAKAARRIEQDNVGRCRHVRKLLDKPSVAQSLDMASDGEPASSPRHA